MADVAHSLAAWTNFYVMTGTSAAALIGLMFVVITLVTSAQAPSPSRKAISSFTTPTVVHFGAALLVSVVLIAPWHLLIHVATLTGLAGLYGVAYTARVIFLQTRLDSYTPDTEDWCWHSILPLVAYGTLLAGSIALPAHPVNALFVVAGAVTLLLFIGIHNAWDIVTYLVVGNAEDAPGKATAPAGESGDAGKTAAQSAQEKSA
jgi:hypothetical protein